MKVSRKFINCLNLGALLKPQTEPLTKGDSLTGSQCVLTATGKSLAACLASAIPGARPKSEDQAETSSGCTLLNKKTRLRRIGPVKMHYSKEPQPCPR